jgi:hypothetical protein
MFEHFAILGDEKSWSSCLQRLLDMRKKIFHEIAQQRFCFGFMTGYQRC